MRDPPNAARIVDNVLLNVSQFSNLLIVIAESERALAYAKRHRRLSVSLTLSSESAGVVPGIRSPHNAGALGVDTPGVRQGRRDGQANVSVGATSQDGTRTQG